tara:strand:+ start:129 stop:374 length:246 start_codon:yes stop_codon:yes gene_type:complete
MSLLDEARKLVRGAPPKKQGELVVRISRRGKYFVGPFTKENCRFRWSGPYDTKKDATDDMRGLSRFIRGVGLCEEKKKRKG